MSQEKYMLSFDDISKLTAGVYATGWRAGLSVRVYESGERSFVYRYRFRNKHYTRKVGEFGHATIEELKDIVDTINLSLQSGIDPFKGYKRSLITSDISNLQSMLKQAEEMVANSTEILSKAKEAFDMLQATSLDVQKGQTSMVSSALLQANTLLNEANTLVAELNRKAPTPKLVTFKSFVDSTIDACKDACNGNDANISISAAFERYIEYEKKLIACRQGVAVVDDSYRLIVNKRFMFKTHILSATKDIMLKDLDIVKTLSGSLIDLRRDHPALADKVNALLRKFLDWAYASHLYPRNDYKDAMRVFVNAFKPLEAYTNKKNHPCLEVTKIPELVEVLFAKGSNVSLAFLFSILTCARSKAVRLSTWDEFDLDDKKWVVPLAHDKSKKIGRIRTIMLSDEACALLRMMQKRHQQPIAAGTRVFGSICDCAFYQEVSRINSRRVAKGLEAFVDNNIRDAQGNPRAITQHGTARAGFKTWSTDHGNLDAFSEQAVEMCLLHERKDFYKGAYDRSLLEDERRRVMARWGEFCCSNISKLLKEW